MKLKCEPRADKNNSISVLLGAQVTEKDKLHFSENISLWLD